MPVCPTHELRADTPHPFSLQIYNGLDCCLTVEILEELKTLPNSDSIIYDFERALQAPALEMMIRGFRVDELERNKAIQEIKKIIEKLEIRLRQLSEAVWDKGLNPRSHKQLKEFFHGTMQLPEIWISFKGQRRLSFNREALEKLEVHLHARLIISTILALRDRYKQLSILETEVDGDSRMRTSYNIAGTETGRWSSSTSSFGSGTNLQNIQVDPSDLESSSRRSIRRIFIADPGWKLCGIDLEQAESREVGLQCGLLFEDWTYLDACLSGDLHTLTCRLIWKNLPWTGDIRADRKIAERKFYREFSYRDMSKRGGHGSNYLGTPWTMSRHLKVPVKLMEDFQKDYFEAFPAIPRWHRWVAQQIQTRPHVLTTPLKRSRHFFGRHRDDTTLREAIAYVPQSSTGDRLNLALWRIWRYLPMVQILAQVHDALYFQYPESEDEAAIISKALSLISTPLKVKDRVFDVPGEAKVGWNWGNFHENINPNGLMKWKGQDSRKRQTR